MDVMDRRIESIDGWTNGWMNRRKINTSDSMDRFERTETINKTDVWMGRCDQRTMDGRINDEWTMDDE